jgi:hypothetical protein
MPTNAYSILRPTAVEKAFEIVDEIQQALRLRQRMTAAYGHLLPLRIVLFVDDDASAENGILAVQA